MHVDIAHIAFPFPRICLSSVRQVVTVTYSYKPMLIHSPSLSILTNMLLHRCTRTVASITPTSRSPLPTAPTLHPDGNSRPKTSSARCVPHCTLGKEGRKEMGTEAHWGLRAGSCVDRVGFLSVVRWMWMWESGVAGS